MTIDRERLAKAVQNAHTSRALQVCPTDKMSAAIVQDILSDISAQGYVIVPREPTEAMLAKAAPWPKHWKTNGEDYAKMNAAVETDRRAAASVYTAMITAANPEQTEQ